MLVIRMQRTGRKGHAQFRVVVQDSRRTPTSGKIVASLGNFDPHSKVATLDKQKAELYLKNGAQPSDRVARLLKAEGVKLPKWVALEGKKKGSLRNPEKLRKNRPAEPEAKEEAPKADEAPAEAAAEVPEPAEETAEATPEETPAEVSETEQPADSAEEADKSA